MLPSGLSVVGASDPKCLLVKWMLGGTNAPRDFGGGDDLIR